MQHFYAIGGRLASASMAMCEKSYFLLETVLKDATLNFSAMIRQRQSYKTQKKRLPPDDTRRDPATPRTSHNQ
jgi:hypothetical protein